MQCPETAVIFQYNSQNAAFPGWELQKHVFFLYLVRAAGRHDDFGPTAYQLASDLMGNDMVVHSQGYGWFNAAYQYTEWAQPTANRHPEKAWRLNSIIS
jgi:hypothetical protein